MMLLNFGVKMRGLCEHNHFSLDDATVTIIAISMPLLKEKQTEYEQNLRF